jgi:MFS family permease
VFYLSAALAVPSAASPYLIRREDIDDRAARGGDQSNGEPAALKQLLSRRDLLVFLGVVVLFHGANGAMLPMAGQVLAVHDPETAVLTLSGCIIVAQATMVVVAALVGRAMKQGVGRKPIFAAAFLILPIRAMLFAFVSDPLSMLAIQVLDGIAAGVFGVMSVVVASDLMAGSGRFNLAQSLSMLAMDAGAGASNVLSGFVVQVADYRAGFLTLAAVALAALIFFLLFFRETAREPRFRCRTGDRPSCPSGAPLGDQR